MSPKAAIATASETIARPIIVKPMQLMIAALTLVGLAGPVTSFVTSTKVDTSGLELKITHLDSNLSEKLVGLRGSVDTMQGQLSAVEGVNGTQSAAIETHDKDLREVKTLLQALRSEFAGLAVSLSSINSTTKGHTQQLRFRTEFETRIDLEIKNMKRGQDD